MILFALRERDRLSRVGDEVWATLSGGPAALVGGGVATRLVTVIEPGARVPRKGSVRWWLERRQARRSALIVAADRPTAVAFALSMKLDLSRIRIERFARSNESRTRLRRELHRSAVSSTAWHSAPR